MTTLNRYRFPIFLSDVQPLGSALRTTPFTNDKNHSRRLLFGYGENALIGMARTMIQRDPAFTDLEKQTLRCVGSIVSANDNYNMVIWLEVFYCLFKVPPLQAETSLIRSFAAGNSQYSKLPPDSSRCKTFLRTKTSSTGFKSRLG